jgi:ferrous iron transport protein B
VLLQRLPDVPPPDLIVLVVDASNLERNLYFATQVIELGCPTVVALNMTDVALTHGHQVNAAALARELGLPVFPLVANRRNGIGPLRDHLVRAAAQENPTPSPPVARPELPPAMRREVEALEGRLRQLRPERAGLAAAEAVLLLTDERNLEHNAADGGAALVAEVLAARARLEAAGVDWRSAPIESRYARASAIHDRVVTETPVAGDSFSDRLDRFVTHRIWGSVIFLAVMALMFQSIFTFARFPMEALEHGVAWVGERVAQLLAPGDLRSLLVDGVIAGVGAVIVFLPQICLLFLFIGLLEDTGYMARAAFLMDRLMSKVGLHGKSFIPMLSSFACAIPGILATRTIESPRDRLVTILIAPLMSCSARLPVYTLLIAACIPETRVLGFLQLPGLTMLGMYLLGITVALVTAWLLKRTLLRGATPLLIMELPPYKRPSARALARHIWDRANQFLRNAGTIILAINIVLWALATYPRSAQLAADFDARRVAAVQALAPAVDSPQAAAAYVDQLRAAAPESPSAEAAALLERWRLLEFEEAGARLRHSFAGRLGRVIEPLIAPLGFDWKIGIGIVSSFAAREVFVSTMSVVYNLGAGDADEAAQTLAQTLRAQRHPDGRPVYSTLTGLTLMVFYVLALQCVSTVVVVRRETLGWRWPLLQWSYMGALAWLFAFATFHLGRWFGLE